MNEMTEAGAKAKGKGKGGKKPASDMETSVEGQVGRMLVRAIWAQEWSAANPEGKPEERKAAWKDARGSALDKHMKQYRRALLSLKRSGVVMSITPAAEGASDEDDAGEDA